MEWSKMSKIDKRRDILLFTSMWLFIIGALVIGGVLFKVSHNYMLFVIEELMLVVLYSCIYGYIDTYKS